MYVRYLKICTILKTLNPITYIIIRKKTTANVSGHFSFSTLTFKKIHTTMHKLSTELWTSSGIFTGPFFQA